MAEAKRKKKLSSDVIEINSATNFKARATSSQTPILIDDTVDVPVPVIMPKKRFWEPTMRSTRSAGKRREIIDLSTPKVLKKSAEQKHINSREQVQIENGVNVIEQDQVSIIEERKQRSKGKGKIAQITKNFDDSEPIVLKTRPRKTGTAPSLRPTADTRPSNAQQPRTRRNLVPEPATITSDEEFARRLQEEEYQTMNGSSYQERNRNIQNILDPYPARINGNEQLARLRVLQAELRREVRIGLGYGAGYQEYNDLDRRGLGLGYEAGYQEHSDLDDMSYEQLWDLSERIGDVKPKGLPKKIQTRLPTKEFAKESCNEDDLKYLKPY
jgi:hypothetical protein